MPPMSPLGRTLGRAVGSSCLARLETPLLGRASFFLSHLTSSPSDLTFSPSFQIGGTHHRLFRVGDSRVSQAAHKVSSQKSLPLWNKGAQGSASCCPSSEWQCQTSSNFIYLFIFQHPHISFLSHPLLLFVKPELNELRKQRENLEFWISRIFPVDNTGLEGTHAPSLSSLLFQ